MKKILVLILSLITLISGKADVIVLKDGNTMNVHNVEVAKKWVYYSTSPDYDAETLKVPIENVFAFKIGDGDLTVLSKADELDTPKTPSKPEETNSHKQIEAVPAADNASLIAAYNNHPELKHKSKKAQPNKTTETFMSLWGVEEGSILSDDNIEVGFEPLYVDLLKKSRIVGNKIKVTNKTGAPIYIDLASSFKIFNGGYSQPYFSNSSYTEGSQNTKGASLNLGAVAGAMGIGGALGTLAGGVNVGGANTQSASITKGEQQILMIPPHSTITLPGDKVSNGTNIIECYEPFLFNNRGMANTTLSMGALRDAVQVYEPINLTMLHDEQTQQIKDNQNVTSSSLGISRWTQTSFTPENSPKKIGRIITYSTSPDFQSFTSLPITLYMRGAFGVKPMMVGDDLFTVDSYEVIKDRSHFIVGPGYIKL